MLRGTHTHTLDIDIDTGIDIDLYTSLPAVTYIAMLFKKEHMKINPEGRKNLIAVVI